MSTSALGISAYETSSWAPGGEIPTPESKLFLTTPARKATFDSIYSEAALYEAALRVYTKPLFQPEKAMVSSHDSLTLYHFARRGPRNLANLANLLSRKEFHFREAVAVEYNRKRKHRIIYLFPWEERIADQWLYQALNRYFHSCLSERSYAFRSREFGVDACQHLGAKYFRQTSPPVYIVKRDVRNYYPSVNQDILLGLLAQWIEKDDYLFQLVQERVKFKILLENGDGVPGPGIPFGTPIACFFANVYLTPVDREMAGIPGLIYFRYADDILAVSQSHDAAKEAAERLTVMLGKLKLRSKPSHELNIVFGNGLKPDHGFASVEKFVHLGMEFRSDGSVGLSRAKARKARNLFRRAFQRSAADLRRLADPVERARILITIARRVIQEGIRSIAILDYYLKHVDDERQLLLLDRWLAEEVLSRAFQAGHRKGNFRRLSFKRMRGMGLPSLLHRQRLLRHGKVKSTFFDLWTSWLAEMERRTKENHRLRVLWERERLPGRKTLSPYLEAAARTNLWDRQPHVDR